MASTSIFAPQVKSVQPAFIYNKEDIVCYGTVGIYLSVSSYNDINDIGGILYSLVDPNLATTWGNNSMLKNNSGESIKYATTFFPCEKESEAEPLIGVEYYIKSGDKYILQKNLTEFQSGVTYYYGNYVPIRLFKDYTKKMVYNQYYQMQFYFVDKAAKGISITNPNNQL